MKTLYRQIDYPVLQNRVYETAEEAVACPRGEIRLVENPQTGLVYNAAFDPRILVYDANYNNEQGNSPRFQSHLDSVADLIESTLGTKNIVEVGCGKGFFLERLLARGFDVNGFDPTYEGSNPRVQKTYFGPGLLQAADGLILRHVLEHIPDPVGFIQQLASANGNRGRIYIEVPCFEWICARRAWFDVFYEHVNYFRMPDFHRMFGRIHAAGPLFGGQYLYVVADLASIRQPVWDGSRSVSFPDDFDAGIRRALPSSQGKTVVWGGASKGVIFSWLRQRAGLPVDSIIDVNPEKQGRYLPCTGLRVGSPEEALDLLDPGTPILVMNSNYLDEIRHMTRGRHPLVPMDPFLPSL